MGIVRFPGLPLLLASLMVVSSSLYVLGGDAAAGGALASAEDPTPSSTYGYHKLTHQEMSSLMASFGSKDPSTDYDVIVGGHGTGLAPPTVEGWNAMVGVVNVVDSVAVDASDLPSSVDLSQLPTFPRVGNQAMQPSCAAWAATYYAYGFLEAQDNNWTEAREGNPEQLLSPAWTYSRVNGGRDSGSSMEENMMALVDWGAATMDTMPYDDDIYLDWGSPSAFREAPAHRAREVFHMPYEGVGIIDQLKETVRSGTPVTFGIDANEYTGAFSDGNYILSAAEYSSSSLNHAQTIVGYDDDVSDDGEQGAFRVVNSWGYSWGDGGFYWMTYDALIELGEMRLLFLNYVSDMADYEPGIVVTWHFDDAPSTSADIEVGVGTAGSPVASKTPFFVPGRSASSLFPTFMCVDLTEFASVYPSQSNAFYLEVGSSQSRGTISSFKAELHEGGFVPGAPSQASGQSAMVPQPTPGSVVTVLSYYDSIPAADALETYATDFGSDTEVRWVAVDHTSYSGGYAMQSGDVGDGESTSMTLWLEGPLSVGFQWRVSSEAGKDVLTFEVPEAGIHESVSGESGWESVERSLGDGVHTLIWTYAKDAASSSLEDTAWVDALTLSLPPPEFSLDESYDALYNQPLTVTPLGIVNPSGLPIALWYDWGDGTDLMPGDAESGYSASHAYTEAGLFTLVVHMDVGSVDNISRSASVEVVDGNEEPVIVGVEMAPSKDVYCPGEEVVVAVTVSDEEGDTVTVVMDVPDADVTASESEPTEPGEARVIEFALTIAEGREAPFVVTFRATDDGDHYSAVWHSVDSELTVDSPPTAVLSASPDPEGTGTTYVLDATASYDEESSDDALGARWDFDLDGEWDTDWSSELVVVHEFGEPGTYVVAVELTDVNGLTDTAEVVIEVTQSEGIPEFSGLLIPVAAVAVIFFALVRLNRRRR